MMQSWCMGIISLISTSNRTAIPPYLAPVSSHHLPAWADTELFQDVCLIPMLPIRHVMTYWCCTTTGSHSNRNMNMINTIKWGTVNGNVNDFLCSYKNSAYKEKTVQDHISFTMGLPILMSIFILPEMGQCPLPHNICVYQWIDARLW